MFFRNPVIATLSLCAPLVAGAESLDVKPGAWEMTYTTETTGSLIPKALLDQMAPEQRANLEAAMKKRAAAGPQQRTLKSCITKEDLAKGAFGDSDRKDCTYKPTAQTATLQEVTFQCTGDGARSGTMRIEAVGKDTVKGAINIVGDGGKVSMALNGKWLKADCRGVDE